MTQLALIVATWFGCGYFPWGPGTIGSLAAVLLAAALPFSHQSSRPMLLLLVLIFLVPGIWAAGRTERFLQKEDPGIVVVDEVLGQWLTLAGAAVVNWRTLLGGLVLFRLFDIWKPWPVRRLESLPGGVGIVADDLMAGVYGALILCIVGSAGLS